MTDPLDVDVTVIVVNWNAGRRLEECVRSVGLAAEDVGTELIVVDNGSTDGSLGGVDAARIPRTRTVTLDRNTGFAHACNRGLDLARGRHALLFNPDARLRAGALGVLVGCLDRHPAIGGLGCGVEDESGRQEPTVGHFPTVSEKIARLLGRASGTRAPTSERAVEPFVDVDWVSGVCLALGSGALAAGIRLDDGYPLYFEDVDLCRRLWAEGFRVVFLPETLVTHARGGTAAGADRRRLRRYGEARYHRKWGGLSGRALALVYACLAREWAAGARRLPDAPRR